MIQVGGAGGLQVPTLRATGAPALLALLAAPTVAAIALLCTGQGKESRPVTSPASPPAAPASPAAWQPAPSRTPAAPVGWFSLAPDIVAGTPAPHADRGPCRSCHNVLAAPPAAPAALAPGYVRPLAPVAVAPAPAPAQGLSIQSVRWSDLEVVTLGPRLSGALGAAPGSGVLVLEAGPRGASSGLAAGDIIVSVAGTATPDLVSFTRAAQSARSLGQVELRLLRQAIAIAVVVDGGALGLGAPEPRTAPAILPGSTPPHGARGACASCHPMLGGG